MKKLIINLLGLNTLVNDIAYLKETLSNVEAENEELKKSLAELTEKVDEMEIPDFDADDFVREDDINDRIESYLNDNDYVTQSYCDDEIESKVSDAVESAVEDIDLDDKVRDVVISEMQKTHPVLMTEDTIRKEVSEAVKVTLERVIKAMADQQG
jgi:hypothetical protein